MTESHGVPSWQWPRCGLPNGAHLQPELAGQISEWLRRDDLLVDPISHKARSRETGLAIMLKAALIYSDLAHLFDQDWKHRGAEQLRTSTVLVEAERLRECIEAWAVKETRKLQPLLGAEREDQDEGEDGEDGEDVVVPGGTDGELHELLEDDAVLPARRKRKHTFDSQSPPPAEFLAPFEGLDLADLNTTESVGDFRAAMNAEPLSAAQVYSRRGLENIAEEPLRRRANKEVRARRRMENPPAPIQNARAAPRPAPAVDYGSDTAESEPQTPPPPKRRRIAHPRPHLIARSSLPDLAAPPPNPPSGRHRRSKAVARGNGVSAKGSKPRRSGTGGGTSRRRAVRRRGPREAPSDSDSEMLPSAKDLADSQTWGSREGSPDFDPPGDGASDSDASLPFRISSAGNGQRWSHAIPAEFHADAATTSGPESEDLRQAQSPMPTERRKKVMAFVVPNPAKQSVGVPDAELPARTLRSRDVPNAAAEANSATSRTKPRPRPVTRRKAPEV